MEINIFELVEELNKELSRLSEVKNIVTEWACEANEDDAYDTMKNLCRLFWLEV